MSVESKAHGQFLLRSILVDHAQLYIGAEIGVARGVFSETLLESLPRLQLYAVDPWCEMPDAADVGHLSYQGWPFLEMYQEFARRTAPYQKRVTVLRLQSVEAALKVPDQSLDFVYIDAQHTYPACKADITAWAPKVKPGGLVMGHDFDPMWPGVMAAVQECYPEAQVDRSSTVWWVRP